MKSSRGDNCFKTVDNFVLLLKLVLLRVSCEQWVAEMYGYLKEQRESVIKGLEKTGIMEAVKSSQDIYTRC